MVAKKTDEQAKNGQTGEEEPDWDNSLSGMKHGVWDSDANDWAD